MSARVSIVVNTLNRAESLRRALLSLRQLNYPKIEVVVVVGPSTDDTEAVLKAFKGQIKIGHCHEPNLSASRNVGIRLASGELVAFIDDDSVPDPWWLDDVIPAFEDPEVVAAGGPVYDHDGATLFACYSFTDVHGDTTTWTEGTNPSRLVAAPRSGLIVYPIGTNSVFRRSPLISIGGFDEEYEYYLDESDVCRRFVDAGWVVQGCDRGWVYHLREPSAIRTSQRVTHDLYRVLRSRAYFAFRHARKQLGHDELMRRYEDAVARFRQDRLWWIQNGLLQEDDLQRFERDAQRAPYDAMESIGQGPKLRAPSWFQDERSNFVPFPRSLPQRRLHVCIVTQEYLPMQLNGIGRLSHELAVSLADRGHVVRILAEADEDATVSFEDGVWVHRVTAPPAALPPDIDAPARIWNFSMSVLSELRRIAHIKPPDVVQIPNWNSEGIAILEDDGFTAVLGLHTPLATVARMDPRIDFEAPETQKLLSLERRCYERAAAFLACGPSSVRQIEEEYKLELPRARIGVVPFGLPDRRASDPVFVPERVNVLFVGRLEARKGIGTLLEAIKLLLPELPEVVFTLVGNDAIPSESGRTYREEFERVTDPPLREERVLFVGVTSDHELYRHYAGCDIFVAPSRSESFGLILLEAMREGKPVVAGDVGGMREVVEHEGNGLLVPPGDPNALADALARLVTSPSLRESYGLRSRALFIERFTAERMAEGYERFCTKLLKAESASVLNARGHERPPHSAASATM
jgi:glycogen(starch) synthase